MVKVRAMRLKDWNNEAIIGCCDSILAIKSLMSRYSHLGNFPGKRCTHWLLF